MEKPYDHFQTVGSLLRAITTIVIFVGCILLVLIYKSLDVHVPTDGRFIMRIDSTRWSAPPLTSIPKNSAGKLILYGRDLIQHTDLYLGPHGIVQKTGNGMRCTNCHLDAGTKRFGNNFSGVAATYPKFRPRFGAIESMEQRINECIVRSLHGKPLDSISLEMQAIVAYMRWLGQHVPKGTAPEGSGLQAVSLLERAADPKRGKPIYDQKCAHCHGENGQGMMNKDSVSYLNPPVWGQNSYTVGAGMYRLGHLAAFVKSNMPWGLSFDAPKLSDEEAWDVAAYINSMPRPRIDLKNDWPDQSKKPVDYPFGPYTDPFTETQHKYGPYQPILRVYENKKTPSRKN